MTEKSDIRNRIREKKRQFSDKELAELSSAAIRKLLSHPAIKQSRTILMYHSLPDEVDTHAAINKLADIGKTVLLPVVTGDGEMEIRRYGGRNSMKKGAYGIMEPAGDVYTHYNNIDVAVVPGMAFDDNNNRLGRGKGYYDRFLAKTGGTYKIGLCFGFQKVGRIPADLHDIKMDTVICDE